VFESVDTHHVPAVARVILQTLPTNVTRKHFGVGVGRNVLLQVIPGVESFSALFTDMFPSRFGRVMPPPLMLTKAGA